MKDALIKRDNSRSRVELEESENFKFPSEIKEAPNNKYSVSHSPTKSSQLKDEINSEKRQSNISIKNISLAQGYDKRVKILTGSRSLIGNKSAGKSCTPGNKFHNSSKSLFHPNQY